MKALFLLLIAFSVNADVNWSIYGDDNRQEVNLKIRSSKTTIADSTAALIVNSFLVKKGRKFKIDAPTLEQTDGVCMEERFSNQPSASLCSGTLIGEDLMLTAAHCYSNAAICHQAAWVFGFHEDGKNRYEVSEKEVYRCKEVIYQELDLSGGKDFAIVKLDRKVRGHQPAKLRAADAPVVGTPLVLIGHPRGLPTKIADGGQILSVDGNVFMTNLDAFTGNSGSGVFNDITNELEGVLSFGREDYHQGEERTCRSSMVYFLQDGGEAFMGITPVREFLNSQQSTRP